VIRDYDPPAYVPICGGWQCRKGALSRSEADPDNGESDGYGAFGQAMKGRR